MAIINLVATKYVDNFQSHLRFDAATAKELEKLNKYAQAREVNEGKFLLFLQLAIENIGRVRPKAYCCPMKLPIAALIDAGIPFNDYKHASVL